MPELDDAIDGRPTPKSIQPILAVTDILATVKHWQDVLGFPGKWLWQ